MTQLPLYKNFFLLNISVFLFVLTVNSQNDDARIKSFYDNALRQGKSYDWLDYLSNEIGGRLSGSKNAELAVEYTKQELEKLGLDVYLQPLMVPKWERGTKEEAFCTFDDQKIDVNICALGGSIGTPDNGIDGEVIEVNGMKALEKLTLKDVKDKIVFLNEPMDPTQIHTFKAYGNCVDQRYTGALEAAKLGAKAVIVRSLNLRLDDYPHTGSMTYGNLEEAKRIPSAAISTKDAEKLSELLKEKAELRFHLKMACKQFDDVQSYNVIAEIKGSEFPDEIILVGGHLDSWDLGDGAHDDGAGVVQSMDVLRLLKLSGIKPKRTIRVVLFMNEENGLRGGLKYAEESKLKNERHIFALESDSGGFTPRGFSFDCNELYFNQVLTWKPLFEPYLIHYFKQEGSGADIGPLKNENIVLAGLRPDSQRYFDYHHALTDTFDAVNKRELELGAATMTSLVFLFDKYGLPENPLKH
ncbi:MAG: M20/M25/M40 family metallo-hydrolase [Lutimonas sp.]